MSRSAAGRRPSARCLSQAEAIEQRSLELLLRLERKTAVQEGVVDLRGRAVDDQRRELFLQPLENGLDLCRPHPRFVVVEERVVRIVRVEAVRVAAAELDAPLEIRLQELEVRRPARLDPDRIRLRRRQREGLAQLRRHPSLLVARGAQVADQAGLDRVVALCFLVRPQLVQQLAESLVDERLVHQARHGRVVTWPDPCSALRHHRLLVPLEKLGELRQVPVATGELPELCETLLAQCACAACG